MSGVAEAQYAQGDVARAVQTISRLNLPLTASGADECEQAMREHGEGNTPLWTYPRYLRTTIHIAQELVRQVREHDKARA